MSYKDTILNYYEKEIDFISEYISKHSNIKDSIDWINNKSADPHLQKLLESFAFIAAKLNYKVDYANLDFNKYIIDMLLPQFNRPIPSTCVISFNPENNINKKLPECIPAYTEVQTDNGIKFKTLYDIDIIPFEIESIKISMARELGISNYNNKSNWFMKIKLKKNGDSKIPNKIRFYINKDGQFQKLLYEMILSNAREEDLYIIEDNHSINRIRGNKNNISNDFTFKDQGEFFNINLSLGKFKALHDYVIIKEKFMFFDIFIGEVDVSDILDIIIPISDNFINENIFTIEKNALKLMSSPVINLYKIKSESIEINNTKDKYRIKPYKHNRNSIIYSINNIKSVSNKNIKYLKYFHSDEDHKILKFWSHIRSKENKDGLKSFINIVDMKTNNQSIDNFNKDIVIGNLICCNKKINIDSKNSSTSNEFDLRFNFLYTPPNVKIFPRSSFFYWHLISHLVRNHIGIISKKFMKEDEFLCDISYVKNLIKIYQSVIDTSLIGIENIIISSSCKKSYSVDMINGIQYCFSTLFIDLRVDDRMQLQYNVLLFSKVISDIFKKSAPINVKVIVNIIKDSDSSLWVQYV